MTHFRLTPSRRIAFLIVAAHVAAAAALLTLMAGTPAGWALAVALVGLGLATARDRALLRAPGSIRRLVVEGPNDVVLELAHRGDLRARVASRRWISAHLVILPIGLPGRRSLLVASDMLEPDAFRRLRLWALWGQLPGVAWAPREAP